MLNRWRKKYCDICITRAKLFLAVQLKKIFYQKKGRSKIKYLRSRYECQTSYVYRKWRKNIKPIYYSWKKNPAVMKIQRCVRCYFAKKTYKRLLNIHEKMNGNNYRKRSIILKNTFKRIVKFMYLQKREKIRSSLKITNFFHLLMKRSVIRQCCRKKIKNGQILFLLHEKFQQKQFFAMKIGTIYVLKIKILNQFMNIIIKLYLYLQFYRWKSKIRKQRILDNLFYSLCISKVEKKYFISCCHSVSFKLLSNYKNHVDYNYNMLSDHIRINDYNNNVKRYMNIPYHRKIQLSTINEIIKFAMLTNHLFPWENLQKNSKKLLSINNFERMKFFKYWMLQYRLRNCYRYGNLIYNSNIIMKNIYFNLGNKRKAAISIQKLFYSYKSKIKTQYLLIQIRKYNEYNLIINRNYLLSILTLIKNIYNKRFHARSILQQFFRINLSKVYVCKQKKYLLFLEKNHSIVNSSKLQRCLCKKYYYSIQNYYCNKIINKLMSYKINNMKRKTNNSINADNNIDNDYNYYNDDGGGGVVNVIKKDLNDLHLYINRNQSKHHHPYHHHYAVNNNDDINEDDDAEVEDDSDNDFDDDNNSKNKFSKTFPGKFYNNDNNNNKSSLRSSFKSKGKHNTIYNNNNNNSYNNNSSSSSYSNINKKKSSNLPSKLLYNINNIRNKSFQSDICYQHLNRLQSKNIYLYDNIKYNNHHLLLEENKFCLENVDVIFCKIDNSLIVQQICDYFSGSKLVFTNGFINMKMIENSFDKIVNNNYHYSYTTTTTIPILSSINNTSIISTDYQTNHNHNHHHNNPYILKLHFSSVEMNLITQLSLIYVLMESNNIHYIRDISSSESSRTTDPSRTVEDSSAIIDPLNAFSGTGNSSGSYIATHASRTKIDDLVVLHCSKMKELSIDSDTIGILPLCILIRALKVIITTFLHIYEHHQICTSSSNYYIISLIIVPIDYLCMIIINISTVIAYIIYHHQYLFKY
jgi:hypothetical protein